MTFHDNIVISSDRTELPLAVFSMYCAMKPQQKRWPLFWLWWCASHGMHSLDDWDPTRLEWTLRINGYWDGWRVWLRPNSHIGGKPLQNDDNAGESDWLGQANESPPISSCVHQWYPRILGPTHSENAGNLFNRFIPCPVPCWWNTSRRMYNFMWLLMMLMLLIEVVICGY